MPNLKQAAAAFLICALLFPGLSLPAAAAPARAPDAPASCPVVVKNGNFEAQSANWTQTGGTNLISNFEKHSGQYAAYLGGAVNTEHSIKQQITLPSKGGAFRLYFWWSQITEETVAADFDTLTVNLLKSDGVTLLKQVAKLTADPDMVTWDQVSYELSAYAGQTVWLQFKANNDATRATHFFVDDVSIPACFTYLPISRR